MAIRRQMAAYANDSSEAARSKMQQLTVQLQEAEEDLSDTQQQHYLDEQQKILDRMYNEYETYLNNKLDERTKLLKEIETKVDTNQKNIKNTVEAKTRELNTGISNTMNNVLSQEITKLDSVEGAVDETETPLQQIKESVGSTDNFLKQFQQNYGIENFKTNVENISNKIDSINTNLDAITEHLNVKKKELTGGIGGTAQTIVNAASGAVYTELNPTKISAGAVSSIGNSVVNSIVDIAKDTLSQANLGNNTTNNDVNIQASIGLNFPNVKNYSEMLTAMQKDKQFEQMIQDITVNKLVSGAVGATTSTLSKYKYNFSK